MNLDVMGSLEGQVGLLGACTANQYSFLTGLSRAILIGMGRHLYDVLWLIVPLPLAFLVIIHTLRMSVSYRPPSHLSKGFS